MTRIANGLIVDGTGAPGFVGDVVVDGDRIVEVVARPTANDVQSSAPDVVDATGCIVTPGFVDAHAHSDAIW